MPTDKQPFDIRDWLSVAGRRSLGFLLLLGSIGLTSYQAYSALEHSETSSHQPQVTKFHNAAVSSPEDPDHGA